jgi:hypothetical protein
MTIPDGHDVSELFTAAKLPALQRQRVCKRRSHVTFVTTFQTMLGHAMRVH